MPTSICSIDCNKEVCVEVSGSCSGSNLTQCSPQANTCRNGRCSKCSNPGTACCGYCVPEGWGCSGATQDPGTAALTGDFANNSAGSNSEAYYQVRFDVEAGLGNICPAGYWAGSRQSYIKNTANNKTLAGCSNINLNNGYSQVSCTSGPNSGQAAQSTDAAWKLGWGADGWGSNPNNQQFCARLFVPKPFCTYGCDSNHPEMGCDNGFYGDDIYSNTLCLSRPEPTPTPIAVNPAGSVSATCSNPDGPITIRWTDSTNNTFYKIDRRLNSNSWLAPWATLSNADATSAQDYSAVYGNTYSYIVNACRGDQYGENYCRPSNNTATVACPTPTAVPTPTPIPTCAPPNTPALTTSLGGRQSTTGACGQASVTCTNDTTPTWNWTNTSVSGRCAVTDTNIYRSYQLGWTGWTAGITTTYSAPTLADDSCFNATARYQNISQESNYPDPLWIKVDTRPPETPNLTLTCNNSTGNVTASWNGLILQPYLTQRHKDHEGNTKR